MLLSTALLRLKAKAMLWAGMLLPTMPFDDKNEIGVVYRSRINHSLEADLKGYNTKPDLMGGGDVFTATLMVW